MHYNIALFQGSCVVRARRSLVHTVCIHIVLEFLGVGKIFFVTLTELSESLDTSKRYLPSTISYFYHSTS